MAFVAPQQRGRALGVIPAVLSSAAALGAPLGTLIGSFGDWHLTVWFVTALDTLAALGLFARLPEVACSPYRERFACNQSRCSAVARRSDAR